MSTPPNSESGLGSSGARRTSTAHLSRRDVEKVLELMGDEIRVLVSSWSDQELGTGGDIDCAIERHDPSWPLRLDADMRLCQCLEYDLNARYWVLDHDGRAFAIDAIEDAHGLGKYSFPTSLVMEDRGLVPAAGKRATYLTLKKVKKGVRRAEEWKAVVALAREDPDQFEELLIRLLGRNVGLDLATSVLAGRPPNTTLSRHVSREVVARRFRSPRQALVPILHLQRALRRAWRPTGLIVAIVGPDGAGKSMLARRLADACLGLFRREALFHWRPGVLPRPGAFIASAPGDPSRPHARKPHGRVLSTSLLLYHWADFFIGSWIYLYPLKVRTGLVVLERGWWDLLVDPRRYRLNVAPALVRMLGKLLPAPDVTLLCEAPVGTLLARKAELPKDELARQMRAWRSQKTGAPSLHTISTAAPSERVVLEARNSIVDRLETRSIGRLGAGWTALSHAKSPRWYFPRGPARASGSSLLLYQPMSAARRALWEFARLTAGLGGLRLLPRGDPPPRTVRSLLAPYVPRRGSIAVARANHRGRFFALILDRQGDPTLFVKVATGDEGVAALEREESNLRTLGPLLQPPLRAPTILDQGVGVLAFKAERWKPRWQPSRLDDEVVRSLGAFFAAGRHTDAEGVAVGPTHGDFAPWNLLGTDDGWVLIDWESAAVDRPAFYDPFHHLVQTFALLHWPSGDELRDALGGKGHIGRLLHQYALAAGVDVELISQLFKAYLRLSAMTLDPDRMDGRVGLAARSRMASWLDDSP